MERLRDELNVFTAESGESESEIKADFEIKIKRMNLIKEAKRLKEEIGSKDIQLDKGNHFIDSLYLVLFTT